MTSFGLDIGANSVKIVQLKPEKEKYRLIAFGMASLPASLQSEAKADQQAIAETIKKLAADRQIKEKGVVLALPESEVFSRVVELPPLSEAELASAIEFEAEKHIPIPLEEANLDYQVIKKPPRAGQKKEKMTVFLVAAPKRVVSRYVAVAKMAGLQPLSLETELIAVCRALGGSFSPQKPSLVVNIGSLSSDVAIVQNSQIIFTRSISTGGNALARAVARDLGLEVSQAEEYKKSYGLDEEKLEGKVRQAIKPIFDVVVGEIKKVLTFYEQEEKKGIKTIILTGGTAKLPGVVPYLAQALESQVEIGEPLVGLNLTEKQKAGLKDNAPFYTTAIGLAMKKT